MLVILGLVLGFLIGWYIPFQLPFTSAKYAGVAFLAGLDSVLGGARAGIEQKFDFTLFTTGFVTNTLLAVFLAMAGDVLGVDLYLAAVVTFGVRIFQNLAYIRRDLIRRPASEQPTFTDLLNS